MHTVVGIYHVIVVEGWVLVVISPALRRHLLWHVRVFVRSLDSKMCLCSADGAAHGSGVE